MTVGTPLQFFGWLLGWRIRQIAKWLAGHRKSVEAEALNG